MNKSLTLLCLAGILTCGCPQAKSDDFSSTPQPPSSTPGYQSTQKYPGHGFAWENNTLGLNHDVPAPWTPVQCTGTTVSVWGRTFTFGQDLLAKRITSQGNDLFTGSPKLVIKTKSENITDHPAQTTVTNHKHADQVKLKSEVQGKHLTLTANHTVEFDGFWLMQLTLTPKNGPVQLQELTLELPYKNAGYFSKFYQYDFVKMSNAGRASIDETAGAIKAPMAFGYNHHVWLGTPKVGLEFSSETNMHWQNQNPNAAIEIKPMGKGATVRYKIIDKPTQLAQPVTFEWGFYPTPIRPHPKNWRNRIISNFFGEKPPGYDPKLWRFSTFRIGPTNFIIDLPYPGLPTPYKETAPRKTYDDTKRKLKENGIGFVPYSALFAMHAEVPEFRKYHPQWLRDLSDKGGMVHKAWYKKLKNPISKKMSGATFGISLYPKSIQDFLVHTYVQAAKIHKHDGLFYDHANHGGRVVNPAFAQYNIQDHPTKLYQCIFATRAYYQRLYKALKKENPNFLITLHTQKLPATYGAYCDATYPGEAMNARFRDMGRALLKEGKLPKGHPPYLPDHSIYPLDFWIGCYSQNLGFENYFFAQIQKKNQDWLKKHPEDSIKYTRMVMAQLHLIDVPFARTRIDNGVFDGLMLGYQKHFGGLVDPLEFIGPWDQNNLVKNQTAFNVAAYLRPNPKKAALIVSNLTPQKKTETLTLNTATLGLEKISKAVNIETDQSPAFTQNSVTLTLKPFDYAVVVLK